MVGQRSAHSLGKRKFLGGLVLIGNRRPDPLRMHLNAARQNKLKSVWQSNTSLPVFAVPGFFRIAKRRHLQYARFITAKNIEQLIHNALNRRHRAILLLLHGA